MITIVLPVYNEEVILRENVLKLFDFCKKNLKDEWQIIISDNASTDKSSKIGQNLAEQFSQVKYLSSREQGKGHGVINAWQKFESHIYIFMDIDLATDLSCLSNLVRQMNMGYDIVVGSRFVKTARVQRSLSRKFFSFCLRITLKILFNLKIKDAPCGFKAINQRTLDEILPQVQNRTWFFDTEMLVLAERQAFKIKEIPVIWREKTQPERSSKVNTRQVIKDYLKNIYSLYVRK